MSKEIPRVYISGHPANLTLVKQTPMFKVGVPDGWDKETQTSGFVAIPVNGGFFYRLKCLWIVFKYIMFNSVVQA